MLYDKDEFKKQIDEWIHVFRNTKPAPAPTARSPGDPEREAEAIRSKEAVPLLKRDATLKSPSKITLLVLHSFRS